MKIHRTRNQDIIDGDNIHQVTWVELDKNKWLPLEGDLTHKAIHKFMGDNNLVTFKTKIPTPVVYAERCFKIGIIQDWMEAKPITSNLLIKN